MSILTSELKAKWIAALRSGKYTQTAARLRSPTGHCCLGVLCDVINPEGWEPLPDVDVNENGEIRSYDHPAAIGTLQLLKEDIGLGVAMVVDSAMREVIDSQLFDREYAQITLSRMNDRGDSFETIANWIEENIDVS